MTNDQISVALTLFCCFAPYTAGILTVVMVNRWRRNLANSTPSGSILDRIKALWERYVDWMNEE